MGVWGVELKNNDIFMDIYDEFFNLKGGEPDVISQEIIKKNRCILGKDEIHNLWFALALAQWETKSLSLQVLLKVEEIITSKVDLKLWEELDANEKDIKKREIILDEFLVKIKSEKDKAKPRKRPKRKKPIFSTGDCLLFKLENGNYGGAVVIATDTNPETAYNLVATTRINQEQKPTISDFEKAEVLILNYLNWDNKVEVVWYAPVLYAKNYAERYEVIGQIAVETSYDVNNYDGKGYMFSPSYTLGWTMNEIAEMQFKSELTKKKPSKRITIRQLIKKKKWWGIY